MFQEDLAELTERNKKEYDDVGRKKGLTEYLPCVHTVLVTGYFYNLVSQVIMSILQPRYSHCHFTDEETGLREVPLGPQLVDVELELEPRPGLESWLEAQGLSLAPSTRRSEGGVKREGAHAAAWVENVQAYEKSKDLRY